MTAALTRYIAVVLAALALAWAGVAYRSHLIELGHEAGVAEMQARAEVARKAAKDDADELTRKNASANSAAMQTLKDSSELTIRNLRLAVADSDHRNQLLSRRIAGLLDQAAGVRPGPPGAPESPGAAPAAAEGDSTVAQLIETVADNYEICRVNAQTLGDLQDWYRALRAARQPGSE